MRRRPFMPRLADRCRAVLTLSVALFTLSPFALTGCAQRTSASERGVATVPRQAVDPLLPVRQSPLYREAQQDCRSHRFLRAVDSLQRLTAAPGLTADQTAFCREQRAICLRDAGQPVLKPSPTSVAPAPAVAFRPDQADCGPRALALVCTSLHRPASLPALRSAAGTTGKGTTMAGLVLAAKSVGLKATGEQLDLPALKRLSRPAVAWVDGNHYLAVLAVDGDTATIHDPNRPREEEIPTSALLARSGGVLLTLK